MNGMQMMGPKKETKWEEVVEDTKIDIANGEKSLLLLKAKLKEAESHIKEKS